ncbi:phosphatidylinositol mannoside acyltransferase [Luteipulveratus mongoliensis]|uniref:Lipid A biosynthesis acyltransferase n=1 Tax=Luteipulveratus mongoliensis TaxID=571913 RepID=A0A0K1JJI5_9MICO|nr:phosphatidylinositol mannoside acyltransferase [Luteipulveratus mongoliensis]AKU16882.1 lipid A biosynthesis acyltransferase [Luteipulveratus mongoliensis]
MLDVTGNLTLAGYRTGWAIVRRMPERAAYRTFDAIADGIYMRGGKNVNRMRSNYAKVRPELSENDLEDLVRAGMRSYLRYWCDAFRLSTLSQDQLKPRVRLVGDADARQIMADGGSLALFLGHLGNWDVCGAWATTYFAPVTTVAERLKPEELFDEFLEFREGLGMRILPLTGGGDVFRELIRAAKDGAFIPLLADRDLTHRGVTVKLCGHEAKVAAGPAALALTTGAALYALGVHYEKRPGSPIYDVVATFSDRIMPPETGSNPEKIKQMTQQCVDGLSTTIREHTEDWHMMQRVFTDDLDQGP